MKLHGVIAAAAAVLWCGLSPLTAAAGESGRVLATGETVPELALTAWPQGPEVRLAELKGKKPALLFFWTISREGMAAFPQIAAAAKEFPDVQFIGVAVDSPDSVASFFRLKELPFPVGSDGEAATLRLYAREQDRIPMAAVIDRDGRLVWRGEVKYAAPVLDEMRKGTFDLALYIEREKFSGQVREAMKARDYTRVLELLDGELQRNPENMELISFKVRLLDSARGTPDEALAVIEEALKRMPSEAGLYELAVHVCKSNGRWKELSAWYDRMIAAFGEDPRFLLKHGRMEMNQPVERLRPDNAYKLCRAAYLAPKFSSDREKGVMAAEYARALYYCGRPDKALEIGKEAMRLLKDTPEYESAKAYVTYYKNVLELSKRIE